MNTWACYFKKYRGFAFCLPLRDNGSLWPMGNKPHDGSSPDRGMVH